MAKKVEIVYTQTCAYCKPTKEMFKELQKKYNFEIKEIDATTSEGQKLVAKFRIMAVPTVIIDNKVAFVGLPDKAKAEAIMKS